MKHLSIKNICLLTIFWITPLTYAYASDSERAELAKLIGEIDFLITRVDQLKANSHDRTDQRIVFRYDFLEDDLLIIRSAINDHLRKSLDAVRIIAPMHGHYGGKD